MIRKINHAGFAGIILLLAACNTGKDQNSERLPYYNTPDFTPHFLQDDAEVEKQITHHIADFSFTDQENKTVTQENVKGKIHVANFFFTTCPSICPKMASQLETVQKAFDDEDDVLLLSYSVTPWIDSVPQLKKYAAFYNVHPKKWHLLTGSKGAIYDLARKSYFAEDDIGITKDSTEFLHTDHFVLVDPGGRIRGIYNGTLSLETERLIADIRMLQIEK